VCVAGNSAWLVHPATTSLYICWPNRYIAIYQTCNTLEALLLDFFEKDILDLLALTNDLHEGWIIFSQLKTVCVLYDVFPKKYTKNYYHQKQFSIPKCNLNDGSWWGSDENLLESLYCPRSSIYGNLVHANICQTFANVFTAVHLSLLTRSVVQLLAVLWKYNVYRSVHDVTTDVYDVSSVAQWRQQKSTCASWRHWTMRTTGRLGIRCQSYLGYWKTSSTKSLSTLMALTCTKVQSLLLC